WPHQSGGLRLREPGRKTIEDGGSFAVPERDVLERDLAADRTERRRAGKVLHLGVRVEQREDPIRRAERLLDLRPLAGEPADRSRDHAHVKEERDELPGGDLSC